MKVAKDFIFLPTNIRTEVGSWKSDFGLITNNLSRKEQDGLQFPRNRKKMAGILGG